MEITYILILHRAPELHHMEKNKKYRKTKIQNLENLMDVSNILSTVIKSALLGTSSLLISLLC